MDEVYEGGWLPEVGNEPPPKKNNLGWYILGGVAAYYLYKNIK
jgi:hypothetical protein